MTAIRRLPRRRGYALVLVLLFNVLFLMLLGVAWRQMVGVIRVATVRGEQIHCEEGVVCALARAMHMLETGRPPIGSASAYQCYTAIGSGFFLLTFTPGTDPSVEAWSVTVTAQSTAPSGVPYKLDTF
jgi:hypothetical protein